MTDWFHTPVAEVSSAAHHTRGPPTADNILINGTMTSAYGGQRPVTMLTPGKTHRLRLMNTGINNWIHASLDNHTFTVIAADF
ncbi:laccase-like multicopper oxidase, partial [Periconia macrospinosa]